MSFEQLPPIREIKPLDISHFPSPFHAVVFRLWETVPAARIAAACETTAAVVEQTALDMGLPPQPDLSIWDKRGYITTIRNAWHILPYEQLLKVLDMTADQLAVVLKEEDFLFVKVNEFKPAAAPVHPTALTAEQTARLAAVRETVQAHFANVFDGAKPFAFFADTDESVVTAGGDGLRMVYSYCGLYANVLEQDIAMSYPDSLLKMYAQNGINAVWLPLVLYQMVPFPFDESYSVGWEMRQQRLRELVERAAKYGIKVYGYLNEPRNMPLSFFEKHPDLLGRKSGLYGAMCTSQPAVMDYLRYAVRSLCEAVPNMGGFFCITMSENMTHCKSVPHGEPCARCADVPPQQLVADVLCAIYEEATAVNPSIRVVAWTWAWDSDDYMTWDQAKDCIDRLPKGIVLQCNSDAQKPFVIGGVAGEVHDYSMSIPGPSDHTLRMWNYAKERGHEVSAKVQVNVTWECSTLPYLPVFDLVREHMTNLHNNGVKNVMLSWTLGGYPSVNLKVASQCLDNPDEAKYEALLREEYGEWADTVKKASSLFSEAFREFPFDIYSLYFGPQNAGPSNPLFAEPTGLEGTMTCYSYDDIDKWRRIYPRDVYVDQWRKVSEKWKRGLDVIEAMPDGEYKQVAWGAYALFRSSYLQSAFIVARDGGETDKLAAYVAEERELALLLYNLMVKNNLFGYEAANHYYFNKLMLAEKVLNCDNLLKRYQA